MSEGAIEAGSCNLEGPPSSGILLRVHIYRTAE